MGCATGAAAMRALGRGTVGAVSLLSALEPVEAVLMRSQTLLEAPRFGPAGELVYSDVIAGGLWACSAGGEVRELLGKRRGIGGALAHAQGGWVVSGRSVLHVCAGGQQRELLGGEGVCGYNDLGATPEGGLLAGVLRYHPLAGEPPQPGALVELTPAGERRVFSEALTWPNGIACSRDGATVYVSDYERAIVLAVPRAEGGAAREFARSPNGSADGLALDCEGGLWVALGEGGAVARFHPDGSVHETVALPASFVSSISFGGEDMRDVLITTADNELHPELGGTLLLGAQRDRGRAHRGAARLGEAAAVADHAGADAIGFLPARGAVACPAAAAVEALGGLVAGEHPEERVAVALRAHALQGACVQLIADAPAPAARVDVERVELGQAGRVLIARGADRCESADRPLLDGEDRLLRGAVARAEAVARGALLYAQGVEVLVGHQAAVGALPGADVDAGDLDRVLGPGVAVSTRAIVAGLTAAPRSALIGVCGVLSR